ncbi:MAG: M23 family metallopeptidase [Candidatus Humimicrobiaceae bacterium]
MAGAITIISISSTIASFIKKYWHILLILIFIIIMIPVLIFSIAINVLFPQVSREEFKIYKDLTDKTGINWASFMAYDVVRLDNYLKENKPNESVFDLLKINFKEYEIVDKEKEITKIVNGKEIKETITEKEYIVTRELEIHGYTPTIELLKSLNYDTSEDNMTVKKVTDFFEDLNEKEEYEIETSILTGDEITENFDENHKQWFTALIEILPLLDPTSEFDPDKFIIPELSSNPDIPSIWPTQGIVTSEFGEIRQNHNHNGIDIANITGTPVYATAGGTVIAVGSSGNFGKRIMIYHGTDGTGATYVTIYAHLSQFKVDVGDKVNQGTLIALVGNTGYSTGPHLHYEIRVNGSPINPRYLLP